MYHVHFRQPNAKAKESQEEDQATSESKLTVVLPDSVNPNISDSSEFRSEAKIGQSSDNFNTSAIIGDSKKKSDRSGRKLTTLLEEDISNEIEEDEKSLEEEKRAVIEACRYSPSSLCQLVSKSNQNLFSFRPDASLMRVDDSTNHQLASDSSYSMIG